MVRQDIVAGLKNAVERGYSLEAARISLINAGYSEAEINAAANYLMSGFAGYQQNFSLPSAPNTQQQKSPNQAIAQPILQTQQTPVNSNNQIKPLPEMKIAEQEKTKKPSIALIIFLIILLVLLLAGVGAILIFKDKLFG